MFEVVKVYLSQFSVVSIANDLGCKPKYQLRQRNTQVYELNFLCSSRIQWTPRFITILIPGVVVITSTSSIFVDVISDVALLVFMDFSVIVEVVIVDEARKGTHKKLEKIANSRKDVNYIFP